MIVFISNFLNHHQLNICIELSKKEKFFFLASMPTPQEQLDLGYADMNIRYDFVVRMYESEEQKQYAKKLLNEAEIVIAGSCAFPFEMIVPRLDADKLTFWFSERLFKISPLEFFYPPKFKRVLSQCTKYNHNKNFYLLCAGGYVAGDYNKYNAFIGKCFSWGYFPECIVKTTKELQADKNREKIKILWVGRYLSLKRPEYALYAAKSLKKAGINFEIKMIGNGLLYNKIANQIKEYGLEDCVVQIGALPYNDVRKEMDKSDIFIFTTTRREGWGAVLNESMNAGCAVIVDKRAGAAKSMIVDHVNGYLFKSKQQYKKALLFLSKNHTERECIGKNGYRTIAELWNAQTAIDRFYDIAQAILNNKQFCRYNDGPMSTL